MFSIPSRGNQNMFMFIYYLISCIFYLSLILDTCKKTFFLYLSFSLRKHTKINVCSSITTNLHTLRFVEWFLLLFFLMKPLVDIFQHLQIQRFWKNLLFERAWVFVLAVVMNNWNPIYKFNLEFWFSHFSMDTVL